MNLKRIIMRMFAARPTGDQAQAAQISESAGRAADIASNRLREVAEESHKRIDMMESTLDNFVHEFRRSR